MRLFYFALILFTLGSCTMNTALERQPNVILILTDDQGWGDLSYHGNTNLATPNIDSIAYNGAVMENFFVQPVCSPTRAELLTGQYHPRLGVYSTSAGGERMNLGITTMAEVFKSAGYATAAYGKWHNGTQPPYHPLSRGFDDYYGFCSGHWGNYFDPMLDHNGQIVRGNGFLVDDLFDHSMEFIKKNQDNPFFIMLPVNTPHSPMQLPENYWNKFRDKELKMTYHGIEEEDQQFTRAALAMVENIDWNLGRLTNYLKKVELDENTIVLFMSDNGPNGWRWNGGMRGKKGSTDEGGVKSPLFIKWPNKIVAGTSFKQIVGAIDLLPTLANLAQVPLADSLDLDGIDFSSKLITGQDKIVDRVIYNHWQGSTSLRTQNYRLDMENRLYDMDSDIGQTKDISESAMPLRDSLITLKTKWEKEVNIKTQHKERPFPIGAPGYDFSHLPARDGLAHGHITRSNRWPNDSFYTNWESLNDSITWEVDVLKPGTFEVFLYYSCKPEDVGATIQLKLHKENISTVISEAHDPPLIGIEKDRFPRMESFVKYFKEIKMGEITVPKGKDLLCLKTIAMPGDGSIDFRLLNFKRKK
ncbi:arylsulfatase [Flagellimonas sp. HMM57]|uniref:arylsulfatase n=1 Tax=unclassified Flagellimonas TaxID=2644544 RepID=UPI001F0B6CC1|nr:MULTISPECIES: arylsulfatase [unclassified Flagellimonas]UII76464.1 arylsulfatase [Flagellimonas sp. HMM57]